MFLIFERKFMATVLFLVVLVGFTLGSVKEVWIETATEPQAPVVLIDPGHGGEDGGTTGTAGTVEKDINLKVAKYLAAYLDKANISYIMTRDSDISIHDDNCNTIREKKRSDLLNRRKLIENCGAQLFVSIHMNSFALEKYSGLQVYYSENDPESKVLADKMQSYTRDCLQKSNDRKTKLGNDIYLLEKLKCPAVLVECGFLSNQAEAKLLNDSEYRQKLALVLCASICDFLCETANENS